MKFIRTPIENLFIIEPEPFKDQRGMFSRIYCKNELREIGHSKEIVNVNHSITHKKGAIRGMHFQYPPKSEIKIVKCIKGSVFDVAIDLRRSSSTFLGWYGDVLSAENMKMLYIPEGFAHGFQTLSEDCELIYFHSEFYNPQYEGGVRYNDSRVNIQWPLEVTEISKKDSEIGLLNDDFRGIVL